VARHRVRRLVESALSAVRKQDPLDIHRAVQDVENGDPVIAIAIEDQAPLNG
jgi:hypothetical protein